MALLAKGSVVRPSESTALEAIGAIRDELDVLDDWMQRYHYIIEMGHNLPPFPPQWENNKNKVSGCQSQVWLHKSYEKGLLYFSGTSDAAIVKGLIFFLLRIYSGRKPEEILSVDPSFLESLGIMQALSVSRGNGTASMVRFIRLSAKDVIASYT